MIKKYSLLKIVFIINFLFFQISVYAQRDIYLVIGQSNAAGRGAIEAEDMVTLTGVDLYNGTSWENAVNTAATDGGLNRYSTIQNPSSDQGLNFSYTFGRMLNEVTGNQIGLVVNARGSTSITAWEKGAIENYYGEAINQINAALALGGSTLKGIIWHQGESNRNLGSYITRLTGLIADFRADLGMPNLPVIVGELSKQRTDNGTFNTNIKNLSNVSDPSYIANTDYAATDGLQTTDRTHFNSNGQRVLGYRYAAKVLKNIYGYTYVENEIIYVEEDSFVRGGGANENIAQEPLEDQVIRVKETALNLSVTRRSLLKFDISPLTGTIDRLVVDATLMMNADNGVDNGIMDISFYDIDDSWSESTVTFNSAPVFSTLISASTTTFDEDRTDDDGDLDTEELIHGGADLTEFIKDEYALVSSTISLGLKSETDGNYTFKPTTKENAANFALRPHIIASYIELPASPPSSQTTKIAKLTFETDPTDTNPAITDLSYTVGGPSTPIARVEDQTSPIRYFLRTDGTGINADHIFGENVDLGDYYFAAQDIDMGNTYNITAQLFLEQIDISGYENLELRVYLAEGINDDTVTGWDNSIVNDITNDYVHFDYDIDETSTFNPLLWIESVGSPGVEPDEDNRDAAMDTDFDGVGDTSKLTNTFTQYTAAISGTGNLLDITIEFSLNGIDEDIGIDNIEIWGTLINSTCSGPDITWDGTSWSNGTGPDITTPAVINGVYTTNATNGSFSACSLTINGDLIIEENYYIEIENNVNISALASFTVENNGAFIQNNDSSSFTNLGISTVRKNTDILNNWYNYTYWSSPVSGITINTSPLANSTMRYWHEANNYLDVFIEDSGNTNTFTPGSDNIDDNGDDWIKANGTLPMTPGIGFAATHSQSGYTGASSYVYDFIGDFNNGVITAPIVYNPANTGGHWNLIGNPYPCALDFDAFVTNNPGIVEEAAYLWSHSTLPSSTNNGNEQINFSQTDYIIMNTGSGSINNSPGTLLEYIPAGQSFFIAGTANGNVTFNNSMRIENPASNSQFSKNSNTKKGVSNVLENKLWINLTSNVGVFNQVLIAYVDGATNNYDGMSYDAPRNLSSDVNSIIYTLIEDVNDKKFAIQGKAKESLNINEVIPLGFYTSTESAIYELSIEHLQGDFLTSNIVYLKDTLLNVSHNLSEGVYTFSSDTGEFNNRFEILFTSSLLSNQDVELMNNALKVINLEKDLVHFKLDIPNLTIKEISIYDLLGRNLYNFDANKSSSQTIELNNLKSSTYIAKVKLSDNTILNKKFIIK